MNITEATEAGTRHGAEAVRVWLETVHPLLDDLRSSLSPTARPFSDDANFEEHFGYGHPSPVLDAYHAAYKAAAQNAVESLLAQLAWLSRPVPEQATRRTFVPMDTK